MCTYIFPDNFEHIRLSFLFTYHNIDILIDFQMALLCMINSSVLEQWLLLGYCQGQGCAKICATYIHTYMNRHIYLYMQLFQLLIGFIYILIYMHIYYISADFTFPATMVHIMPTQLNCCNQKQHVDTAQVQKQ